MQKLVDRIKKVNRDCHKLCKMFLSYYLPVSGNIGIFCQSDAEYKEFKDISRKITKKSSNPNQKYFELIKPIQIKGSGEIPTATYTHLYIRKPDKSLYGKFIGDVDFSMQEQEYKKFKDDVQNKKYPEGVQIYDRPNWDTIELSSPNIQSVAYVSTHSFAEKVRIKFD